MIEFIAIFAATFVVVIVGVFFVASAVESWGYVNYGGYLDFFMWLFFSWLWIWLSWGWLMEYLS